jgi:hypothetical protein
MSYSIAFDKSTDSPVRHNDFREERAEDPDFRIIKSIGPLWLIKALSQTAATWLRVNFEGPAGLGNNEISTDRAGANRFICKARGQSYRIEYIGPLGVNIF